MNTSGLVELKYLSEASEDLNFWSLTSILDAVITSNQMRSVTGILFFDQGYFGQILEGPRVVVEELWDKIKNDSRHRYIELLGITEIEERRFPKWSMKLFDAQEFSVTFPQFAERITKINDPDAKTLETMKALWQEV